MSDLVGYFMVMVEPDKTCYASPLPSGFDKEAERLIKNSRELIGRIPGTRVISPQPGLAQEGNEMLGSLCATLVEVITKDGCATSRSFKVAAAISKIANRKYWWVTATIDAGGTRTAFLEFPMVLEEVLPGFSLPMPVNSVEQAMRAVDRLLKRASESRQDG